MKKLIVLLVTGIICSTSAFSQPGDGQGGTETEFVYPSLPTRGKHDSVRNINRREFFINPLSFIVSGFEVGYAKIFNDNKEILKLVAGYYISADARAYDQNFDASNMEGFRLEAQYLFTKPITDGMRYYLGPYMTYKSISLTVNRNFSFPGPTPTDTYKAKGAASGVGLIFGFRSYTMSNFYLDMYVGGGPTFSLKEEFENDIHLNIVNPYKRGINPRFGLSLGMTF